MKKRKPYWEMNADELAKATRAFDDPQYAPPAKKLTAADRSRLAKWRQKRVAEMARLTVSLDKLLIEQTDNYAASKGITFSEVVADALRQLMRKKSA